MKILHVAETARGGVSTYLNEILALQTAELGAEAVRVIVPAEHARQISNAAAGQLISFRRPVRSAGGMWRLTLALRQAVREWRPDVIHAHSSFAGAIVRALYGWRRRRPVIVYCPHGWAFDMQIGACKSAILAGCENILARLGDHVIAISKHEASAAARIGINSASITTIYNGLAAMPPLAAVTDWQETRRKILFVGRLDRQKGFDVLAEAVAGLSDQVALRVAGAAVVETANRAADNISYLGWLNAGEVEGQLQHADLLVMPSRWEGLGLTALEAMRAAKPVVAAAVGGLKEVVADGITGRLVPANDVRALREAMLADDDAALRAMGQAGRALFLRDFSSDRMHQKLMALYASLLERAAIRGNIGTAGAIIPAWKKDAPN